MKSIPQSVSESTKRRNPELYGRTAIPYNVTLPDAEQRKCEKELVGSDARETQGAGCLHVRFTLCRVRLLDVDAKYSSVKDLLDCLTNAGIISGDKEGQITLEVRQVKCSKKEERTVIEVFSASGQDNSPSTPSGNL